MNLNDITYFVTLRRMNNMSIHGPRLPSEVKITKTIFGYDKEFDGGKKLGYVKCEEWFFDSEAEARLWCEASDIIPVLDKTGKSFIFAPLETICIKLNLARGKRWLKSGLTEDEINQFASEYKEWCLL